MQHKKAREREADGRFDFTTTLGDHITPIGYCHAYREPDPGKFPPMNPSDLETMRKFRDKYHDDGHATPEEAQVCYKEYLLDQRTRTSKDSTSQHKCVVCGQWTQNRVWVGNFSVFVLCEEHADREHIASLFDVGEIWES